MRTVLAATLLTVLATRVEAQAPNGTALASSLGVDVAQMHDQRGVLVRDLTVGTGRAASREMTVAVRYTLWLADGTAVDSTKESEPPVTFTIGKHDVVRGWEEGVVGMRVGGRRQLVIPPKLAYGAKGNGPVPADATLVFTVELVDVR